MSETYSVHIRRTLDYQFFVQADSAFEAGQIALENELDDDFDREQVSIEKAAPASLSELFKGPTFNDD